MLRTFQNVFLLVLTLSLSFLSQAQDTPVINLDSAALIAEPLLETFQSKSTLDPNRAAFYSAVVPGLGQIYNKQYWKLPIIYGGAILIGHYIKYNHDFYNAFRNAYIAQRDGQEVDEVFQKFSESRLQFNAERFKRDRDFLIIIGCAFYVLNIVDAHVAAHLSEFDINESLSITPIYQPNSQFTTRSMGLSLTFNLSK